ncbi:Uncharacterized protein FWK35_00030289, partial [Aphis craccivora]
NQDHSMSPPSPHTPTKSKRNLSNSSLSPSLSDEKSKIFITPNRYAVLDTDKNESTTLYNSSKTSHGNSHIPDQNNDSPAPPIYIKDISNYSSFKNLLTKLIAPNGFTCKSSTSYLIVQPSSKYNFNIIVKHLKDTNAKFHAFKPRQFRSVRFVIRNLHFSTTETDIIFVLSELGHSVVRDLNILDKNKRPLPLFFLEVSQDPNNIDILNISSLLNTKCQSYGHTQNYCYHVARCAKCGAKHHTNECSKDRNSPAKCTLCSLDHTSNFKGCQTFKQIFKKSPLKVPLSKTTDQHSQPDSKTYEYAEAINNQDTHTEIPSTIFSQFISNLNALISPLMILLSSVLKALVEHNLIFFCHREGWQESIRVNYKDFVLVLAKYSPALAFYVTSADISLDTTFDVSRKEQLSLVIRYINKEDGTVCERLIALRETVQTTEIHLLTMLYTICSEMSLEWRTNLVGQSYDSAASMRSSIIKENPSAMYIWCWAHWFNLVVIDAVSCCIEALDLFGYLERLYDFKGSNEPMTDRVSSVKAGSLLDYLLQERFLLTALIFKKIFDKTSTLKKNDFIQSKNNEFSFAPLPINRIRRTKKMPSVVSSDQRIIDQMENLKVNTFYTIFDITTTQITKRFNEETMPFFKDLSLLSHKRLKEVAETNIISKDAFKGFSEVYGKFVDDASLKQEYVQFSKSYFDFEKIKTSENPFWKYYVRRSIGSTYDNGMNPHGHGQKAPMKTSNRHIWEPILQKTMECINNLTWGHDKNLMVEHKIKQDHIELFFNVVRARGSWCVNPTPRNFSAAYKKLLAHHQIKTSVGNIVSMDNTEILYVTRTKTQRYSDTLKRKFDTDFEDNEDSLVTEEDICNNLPDLDYVEESDK